MNTPITSGQQQAERLALEILELSRSTLLIRLRFLEPALCQLPFEPDSTTTLATDGFRFYYDFKHVLKLYRTQKELLLRDYLHTVFHCLFHHPFMESLDPILWDLSCDIAVEAALTELELPELSCLRCQKQHEPLRKLSDAVPVLTAERLYRYFREQDLPLEQLEALHQPFRADEHELWYQLSRQDSPSEDKPNDPDRKEAEEPSEASRDSSQASPGEDQPSELESERSSSPETSEEDAGGDQPSPSSQNSATSSKQETIPSFSPARDSQEQLWSDIASGIETDLTTLSRQYGTRTGTLLQNIRECTREKTDYREFLRKFSVLGEEIRINDEEFDYIYYTYGLDLYGDIPLIEPLEYKEAKKIRDFVIAIDTSASVKGAQAASFVQKTFEILCQEESFFRQTNLHLITCDTAIQEITVLRSEEDLQSFLRKLEDSSIFTLHGFGGTDFRPVFSYVEEQLQKGEWKDLRGLLYFTDGDGLYPTRPTPYYTVFVFTEEPKADIPVWALKVILDQEEL